VFFDNRCSISRRGADGPLPLACFSVETIRGDQLQGLQSDGVVVGQTLLSDQPPGRQVTLLPPRIPRLRSMGVKRRMVSLDSETFLSSFFMVFPSKNNRMNSGWAAKWV
jgi:hypothetical protein